ncbi:HNH endonuclease [Corynebacterium sp. c8Ua_99]|uniref:HNH endonuclease signature motif containing protein n=1 Tax=Corynebacterium sp. c8Ua_99 TaxID=3032335 RepID=UPI003263CA4B
MKSDQATEPYWAHENSEDELSALARATNRAQLELIEACCPAGDDDVENHAARISVRLGITRSEALRICDIGLLLEKMPQLAEYARESCALSMRQLGIIAHGVVGIEPDQIPDAEKKILALVTPRKRRQAMIGPRTLTTKIGDIAADLDDRARADGTIPTITDTESVTLVERPDSYSQIILTLRPDRAYFAMCAIETVFRANEEMTQADAFVELIHQRTNAEVVLNVFREPHSDDAWLDGAGWLGALVTEEWMQKVTHVRLSADSATNGYRPTPAQVARVHGRDGTCRFPGCEVPAYKCDIDHIAPYNQEDPEAGGPTDTQNLHCLCRKHHNLKTHKLWDITAYEDGSEVWSSADGVTAATVPAGPLAGFGRQTFDKRATQKTKARHDHYMKWWLSFAAVPDLVFDDGED